MFYRKKNQIKFLSVLSLIVALTFFSNISVFDMALGNNYYVLMIVTVIILRLFSFSVTIGKRYVFLIFSALLSIYFNEIPAFFKPYERFISFTLLLALLSPLLTSNILRRFRHLLFLNFIKINVALVIGSFIGIAIGLPLVVGRGGYVGLFNHSMVLGPMAALATLTCLCYGTINKHKKLRFLCFASAAITFTTCIAAGSRGALIALIISCLVFFYKINQGKLFKYVKVLLLVVMLGLVSFPLWKNYTERLIGKMEYAESNDSLLFTREALWQSRFKEFESSPIYGIGFASIDTTNNQGFDAETGAIEPGSSWLAVLSMLGVLGILPILLIISRYIFMLYNVKVKLHELGFLSAVLTFFIVHMTTEGYIFSAGSGLFFVFWLTLGNIDNYYRFFKQKKMYK